MPATRTEVEQLLENYYIAAGWWCVFYYTLPSGRDLNSTPAHFPTFNYTVPWGACDFFTTNTKKPIIYQESGGIANGILLSWAATHTNSKDLPMQNILHIKDQ